MNRPVNNWEKYIPAYYCGLALIVVLYEGALLIHAIKLVVFTVLYWSYVLINKWITQQK
jgi:hypothetical protein